MTTFLSQYVNWLKYNKTIVPTSLDTLNGLLYGYNISVAATDFTTCVGERNYCI
jgi:hypothetical protein